VRVLRQKPAPVSFCDLREKNPELFAVTAPGFRVDEENGFHVGAFKDAIWKGD